MSSTTRPVALALPTQRARRHDEWELTLPCREHDGELWFAQEPVDVELAKTLCGECPVRAACLAGALERQEPWGVWGGELLLHGRVVPRKRPRGRPRKDADVAASELGSGPVSTAARPETSRPETSRPATSRPAAGDVDAA